MALSSFLIASPHFVFGSGQYALSFTADQDEIVYLGLDIEDDHSERSSISSTTEKLRTSKAVGLLMESSEPGIDEGLMKRQNVTNISEEDEWTNLTTVEEIVSSSSTYSFNPRVTSEDPTTEEEYVTFPYSYARGKNAMKIILFLH